MTTGHEQSDEAGKPELTWPRVFVEIAVLAVILGGAFYLTVGWHIQAGCLSF
ncbi:MAG: hypothetical protein ACR2O0_16025 [Rhizobiaceae bacterium]